MKPLVSSVTSLISASIDFPISFTSWATLIVTDETKSNDKDAGPVVAGDDPDEGSEFILVALGERPVEATNCALVHEVDPAMASSKWCLNSAPC